MENKPKRPVSVWIAQIILLLGVLFSALLVVVGALLWGKSGTLAVVEFVPLLISLGLAAFFFFAFWGMAKRQRYGRWLGVAALSLTLLVSLLGQIFPAEGPLERYEYKNSAERLGGIIGGLTIFGLFLWLILHVAFSKRVTEFFNSATTTEIYEPPSLPTFDD
jgi:hypothetical protein